jgi:hypothetical protein
MNQAIFAELPPIRPFPFVRDPPYQFLTYQYDEMCSVGLGQDLIRQLNSKWWAEFIYPLPAGTRVEIRHDVNARNQVTYQVIAIENDSFRVVAFAYLLDETGPVCDMTSEQYRERFYPAQPIEHAAAAATFATH